MSLLDPCLIRSRGPSGQVVVRLGVPLVDDYLEFLEGRRRPNTVLAAAYDLKVFLGVVDKAPAEVRAADVLGFITAQGGPIDVPRRRAWRVSRFADRAEGLP